MEPPIGGSEGDMDEEELARKMEESIQLNAQLKAMLQHAEMEESMRQQQVRQQMRTPGGGRQMLGAPRPKNGGWGGMTHTDGRMHEIQRHNQILVSKLSNIDRRRPLVDGPPVIRQNPQRSTVAINRRKKDDQIARENAALARRLGSVKPTKGLSVQDAKKHDAAHSRHLATLRSHAPAPKLMASGPQQQPRPRPGSQAALTRPPPAGYGEFLRPREPFT
mmetsp:Transcript_49547/g.129237  ORF Transcript_49547/g.129237 Transcript_49547/m.129237 type:complete len:220 (+) Transcript_49547:43-702(+)